MAHGPLTLIVPVGFDYLCVPLAVKLLNQWSGVDINELSVNNEFLKPHESTQNPHSN